MEFAGASSKALPSPVEGSPASINYFVGTPTEWRRGVRGYRKVEYSGIYHGIDLVFYGNGGQLEYDLVVHPGARPEQVSMTWRGARRMTIDPGGALQIETAQGVIRWNPPAVYQANGSARTPVAGRFRLLGRDRVGFEIAAYNRGRNLVIDPALAFATYLGGSAAERARGIAVDNSGNVYVTGFTASMDLPVTSGVVQAGYGGNTASLVSGDAFVAKYSASGNLLFLTYLGGRRDDIATAVAVDSAGNPYVTGYTNSTDFPTTPGALQTSFGGFVGTGFALRLGDAFLTKLSADGKSLLYSTYLGGSNDDAGFAIAVDGSGNAFVAGTTLSTNFPTSTGAYQTRFAGSGGQENFPLFGNGLSAIVGGDAFVAKLNATGSALLYSTLIGGSSDDVATSLAIDSAGNAYIGGYTLSTNFPTTTGAFQTKFGGYEIMNQFFTLGDGFAAKVNPNGTGLVYSTYIGGSGDDWVSGLALDSSGNLYLTGSTTSMNFPVTPGSFQALYQGPQLIPFAVDFFFGDAYVLKLNPAGTSAVFATYLGGPADDCAFSIALDATGNILVAGLTNSTIFPVSTDAVQHTLAGPPFSQARETFGDGFIAQLSPNGATRLYATYFGGTGDDALFSLAVSPSGTVYAAGMTVSGDLPVLNARQPKSGGVSNSLLNSDAFVMAISGFVSSGSAPAITAVLNAGGETAAIGQNTYVEIKGANLATTTRTWLASDFVNNQLPTVLDGVKVTVNGKPAFISYVDSKQVNILTPLDSATGTVAIALTTPSGAMATAQAPMQAYAPGFAQIGTSSYVAAQHSDYSVVGPASLYPGITTPAKPGETVILWATGFGQTNPPIVNGSLTQSGTLPNLPMVTIGGVSASIAFAGVVAPGAYQINVTVPASVPDGDLPIVATYNGFSTKTGVNITVQH
jgi:uncharacterized protein (TIGR03437 family)